MCIAKAYIRENGEEKPVMEEVASIRLENGTLVLHSLFGEQKEIEARIREVDFIHNSIALERG